MKNSQMPLKLLLLFQLFSILIYTYFTIGIEGTNFFAAGIEHLKSLQWKGQFTLDFSYYLMLSALWILWKEKYSSRAFIFALLAMIWGIMFFAPYLFYLLMKENGDIAKILLGDQQANKILGLSFYHRSK